MVLDNHLYAAKSKNLSIICCTCCGVYLMYFSLFLVKGRWLYLKFIIGILINNHSRKRAPKDFKNSLAVENLVFGQNQFYIFTDQDLPQIIIGNGVSLLQFGHFFHVFVEALRKDIKSLIALKFIQSTHWKFFFDRVPVLITHFPTHLLTNQFLANDNVVEYSRPTEN